MRERPCDTLVHEVAREDNRVSFDERTKSLALAGGGGPHSAKRFGRASGIDASAHGLSRRRRLRGVRTQPVAHADARPPEFRRTLRSHGNPKRAPRDGQRDRSRRRPDEHLRPRDRTGRGAPARQPRTTHRDSSPRSLDSDGRDGRLGPHSPDGRRCTAPDARSGRRAHRGQRSFRRRQARAPHAKPSRFADQRLHAQSGRRAALDAGPHRERPAPGLHPLSAHVSASR